jgi:hypothetical protein
MTLVDLSTRNYSKFVVDDFNRWVEFSMVRNDYDYVGVVSLSR